MAAFNTGNSSNPDLCQLRHPLATSDLHSVIQVMGLICSELGIKQNIVSFSKHFKEIHYKIRPDHDIVKNCFISQGISATKQNPGGKKVKASIPATQSKLGGKKQQTCKPNRFKVVKVESVTMVN